MSNAGSSQNNGEPDLQSRELWLGEARKHPRKQTGTHGEDIKVQHNYESDVKQVNTISNRPVIGQGGGGAKRQTKGRSGYNKHEHTEAEEKAKP